MQVEQPNNTTINKKEGILSYLQAWNKFLLSCRHGISHGCTNIIDVKNLLIGVLSSSERILLVLDLLPVALLGCF